MEYLSIVKQKDISEQELLEVCKIKSVFGDYSIGSQKQWILKNLYEDDLHFLLYNDDVLVAYLNLVDVRLLINGNLWSVYGIGNVCSSKNGSGFGSKIVRKLNDFLVSVDIPGYLFCKQNLISFYSKNGWAILDCDNSNVLKNIEIKSMIFNFKENVNNIDYTGRLF
ncbi:GNAT family N-acetyltransferase [Flavobacterium muglaense]|uniref:GNAT family N-acetyltransferase n=1 Tax=Flavobacterium muglaense TaxID=2764716 RepID=A0A923SEH5_9FLAO|nr:GNAT family N-acetyltransferase [Flavobacterium muglaense]MBC5837038.1 GNAT family N-acetyltransferase [Flavobacterium muglaense]MBC5843567.1 GNAT family N-acetyltransferase [Flavobacterium muglaense]